MAKTRFVTFWRKKFHTIGAKNLKEMVEILKDAAAPLHAMLDSGKVFFYEDWPSADYVRLYTFDYGIAEKFRFVSEKEFNGDE